jgi:glycosyltransferase involved in cell wall biosynthesis
MIDGDIVYAIKARPVSLGLGVWAKQHLGRPLALDIDDWEVGGYLDYPRRRRLLLALNLSNPNGYTFTRLIERQIGEADAITTVSTFLQHRFGGVIVPHGRDARCFDPARYEATAIRQRHGLPRDKQLLLFLGTPRRHKGIDILLEALHLISTCRGLHDVHSVIAGIDWNHPLAPKIREWSTRLPVTLLGMQPFAEVPALLVAADIAIIPQSQRPFSQAQIPAKLIDAMAMGKPIVASAVSDIPTILEGCGLTVPPGDAQAVANAVEKLLTDRDLADSLGQKARQRFLKCYTWDAMAEQLLPLFERLEARVNCD